MPVVGSSRMRTRAPSHSRRRSSSCCRSPTVSEPTSALRSMVSPRGPARSAMALAASARRGISRPGAPMSRLSTTRMGGKSRGSWCSMPTPWRMASAGERKDTALPSRSISPLSAGWKPDSIFMSVLLPAPFSPRTPWMVPAGTERVIPSLALTGPKCLWMFLTCTSNLTPARRSGAVFGRTRKGRPGRSPLSWMLLDYAANSTWKRSGLPCPAGAGAGTRSAGRWRPRRPSGRRCRPGGSAGRSTGSDRRREL